MLVPDRAWEDSRRVHSDSRASAFLPRPPPASSPRLASSLYATLRFPQGTSDASEIYF